MSLSPYIKISKKDNSTKEKDNTMTKDNEVCEYCKERCFDGESCNELKALASRLNDDMTTVEKIRTDLTERFEKKKRLFEIKMIVLNTVPEIEGEIDDVMLEWQINKLIVLAIKNDVKDSGDVMEIHYK
jgi:hypothetical protein